MMCGLRIRDAEDGFLTFDLADILKIVGQRALDSHWRCSDVWCISQSHTDDLESEYEASGLVPGPRLFQLAAATRQVIDMEIPGMAEAMRAASLNETPFGMLSRGLAGARRHTLIINLPGSPKAVRENLAVLLPVIPHAIEKLQGDSSECGKP